MPTVDFGGCLSNYWFVMTINGVATVIAMVINMVMSHFFLKHFHKTLSINSSAPKKPKSKPPEHRTATPITEIPVGSWGNETLMGDVYQSPYPNPNYYYNGY